MDGAVGERRSERRVHEPVLLEQRQSRKAWARDRHLEVITAACAVLDAELGCIGERVAELTWSDRPVRTGKQD